MSQSRPVSILAFCGDPWMGELVRAILGTAGHQVVTAQDPEEAFVLAGSKPPDLFIVDVTKEGFEAYALCRRIRNESWGAQLPILILTTRTDLAGTIAGYRAGVDGYLPKPFDPQELAERVNVLLKRTPALAAPPPQPSSPPPRAKTIAVFSARGGVGKTTLAVNMALALNRRAGARVLLVDGDFYFGGISVHLNLPNMRTIMDLIPHINELEQASVEKLLQSHRSGLRVLLSPNRPEDAETLEPGHVKRLLEFLTGLYEFIVVDCQTSYDERTLVILEHVDDIVLVTVPELSAIVSTSFFLELAAKLGVNSDRIHVVLNRANSNVGMGTVEIERALRHPIAFSVNSGGRQVAQSINRGAPLMFEDPGHSFSRQVARVAEQFSMAQPHAAESTRMGQKALPSSESAAAAHAQMRPVPATPELAAASTARPALRHSPRGSSI